MTTFRTVIEQTGKTTTGIRVPAEIVEGLGAGKRPKVRVTINGATYRSSIASMGGGYMVGVSAENRALTGVSGGDEVDVTLEVDSEPRTVDVPEDFAAALAADPAARDLYHTLSFSQQRWFVGGIQDAKTDATRQRRIAKAVERLASGRGAR
jgi:Bacteriocin-protection, YdeI or OmpD-Associated/Domain of unknown function (DUF1905)